VVPLCFRLPAFVPLAFVPPPMPRKPFLLRVDPKLLEQLQRWADDDLRSLNGQIEYLLRKALQESGRAKQKQPGAADAASSEPPSG
jgi:hypothetical protein